MPETPLPRSKKTLSSPGFYSQSPWKCRRRSGRQEIAVFVESSGKWETIAVIQPASGTSAQMLAGFITGLVNECQQNGNILDHAREALEMLVRVGVNFSTEEDAEAVIASIKKLRPLKQKSPRDRT